MTVVSILGLAGETTVYYDTQPQLPLIAGSYRNATQALIHSLPQASFIFLGTDKSIEEQKKLLADDFGRLDQASFRPFDEHDPLSMFAVLLEVIRSDDEVLIDVTHGFRDISMIAMVASSIAHFGLSTRAKIIYARVVTPRSHFCFESLDHFLDISHVASTLGSFVGTLTIPHHAPDHPLIHAAESFCQALHANHLKELWDHALPRLYTAWKEANEGDLRWLDELLAKVHTLLLRFGAIAKAPPHQQYLLLGKLMEERGYILIASTYLYEALPLYLYHAFAKKGYVTTSYDFSTQKALKAFVRSGDTNPCLEIQGDAMIFYCANKERFDRIYHLIEQAKNIRNRLAHLDTTYHHENLRADVVDLANAIQHCFELDPLGHFDPPFGHLPAVQRSRRYFERLLEELLSHCYGIAARHTRALLDACANDDWSHFDARHDFEMVKNTAKMLWLDPALSPSLCALQRGDEEYDYTKGVSLVTQKMA